MIRTMISTALLGLTLAAAAAPTAAVAREDGSYSWQGDNAQRWDERRGDDRRWDDRRWDDRRWDDRRWEGRRDGDHYAVRDSYYGGQGYYAQPAYRNYDRRSSYYGGGYRCRNDGTTGTIIGAIAGGLIGNGVAGRGDRTLGTVLGGGAGALAGRAIDRDGSHRC